MAEFDLSYYENENKKDEGSYKVIKSYKSLIKKLIICLIKSIKIKLPPIVIPQVKLKEKNQNSKKFNKI